VRPIASPEAAGGPRWDAAAELPSAAAPEMLGAASAPVAAGPGALPAAVSRAGDPAGTPLAVAAERARRFAFVLYALHLFTVWAIALSNILLGASLLATFWATWRHRLSWRACLPIVPPLALYLLCLVGSIAGSYDVRGGLAALGALFSFASLYLGMVLVRGEVEVRRVVDTLGGAGALLACAGLAQYASGYGGLERRIRGPFFHYMSYSGVLLLCDLMLLAGALSVGEGGRGERQGRGLARHWRWPALAVTTVALLGTMTRGALVAFVAAVALLAGVLAAGWRPGLRWPRAAALALLLAAVAAPALMPVSWLRRTASIFSLRDVSNYDRLCMLEAGIQMVRDRPLFGLGPDQVRARYALYRHPSAPRFWVPHLHNSLLELAAEQGLGSLAAFAALFGTGFAALRRGWRSEGGLGGARRDLYLASGLGLVAYLVAGLFENNWGDSHVRALALFLLALPFCLRQPPQPPPARD
jgi:O-antigen ligase